MLGVDLTLIQNSTGMNKFVLLLVCLLLLFLTSFTPIRTSGDLIGYK